MYKITNANIKEWAKNYEGEPFDAILCDPPYELGFMGKSWDSSGIAFDQEMWADLFRHIKPGGHLLAFSGSRTYHRMAVAIEDAGFEIRDMIEWVYGSGFPKSLDISKAIDKNNGKNLVDLTPFGNYIKERREAKGYSRKQLDELMGTNTAVSWWEGRASGVQLPSKATYEKLKPILELDNRFDELIDWAEAEREIVGTKTSGIANKDEGARYTIGASKSVEVDITIPKTANAQHWNGYGTALKPAHEPCVLARKPIEGTVANNVLKHGTGGLDIDGTRVGAGGGTNCNNRDDNGDCLGHDNNNSLGGGTMRHGSNTQPTGRFPANLIHDGSDEVEAVFPQTGSGKFSKQTRQRKGFMLSGSEDNIQEANAPDNYGDSGSASRFFFSAKPDLYCSLCYGIMEVCENNANNAQPSSALGTQAKDTAQEPVAEQQPPKLEDKNLKQTSPAHNVVNTLASTNQTTVNTAQPNATQNLKELLDLAAKYAESQCLQCQTSIAQKLVVMATESMELQACQDFTQDYKNSIQTENLVSTVAYLANIDITQTTINLMKLCGFAHLATDENTKQASQRSDNATSRLKYTAKASKSERNAGLEGFELKENAGSYEFRTDGSLDGKPTEAKANFHPTVKPLSLTKYLATLIKPPTGGRLLVPFSGSGSEMIGALQAGWEYVEGVELTEEYIPIAEARIKYWLEQKEIDDNKPTQEVLL